MSYREAHSAVVNTLAQFEQLVTLKETLAQAAEAEAFIAKAQEERDAVQKLTDEAHADLEALEKSIERRRQEAANDHAKAEAEWAARVAQWQKDAQVAKDAYYSQRDELAVEREKLIRLNSDEVAALVAQRNAAQDALAAVQKQIAQARGELADIKQRLAGV